MNEQLVSSEWTRANPDWLTIPQAKFFFAPDYVKPGAEFRSFVERRYREMSFEAASPSNVVQLSDFAVSVRRDEVQLVVDGESGRLELGHIRRSRSLSADGFSDVYYRLVSEPDAPGVADIEQAHRNAVVELASFAVEFSIAQRSSFQTALEMGHAMLVGRWHDLTAPFRPIQPDQWRQFRYNPAASPIARAEHGSELIYSPMVMPVERASVAATPAQSTSEPILSWLIGQMQSNPNKPRPKSTMREEAQNRCTDLSERKFNSLWTTAIASSGTAAWSAPGRRK